MRHFFRFPRTPHLPWLGAGSPRDDKVLTRAGVRAEFTQAIDEHGRSRRIEWKRCKAG